LPNWKQKQALGYTPGVFDVPPRLRKRVDFWKKVYTVHPSTEAIIHYARQLDIVYGAIDLTAILPHAGVQEPVEGLQVFKKPKKS
jgi:hypothetical protein